MRNAVLVTAVSLACACAGDDGPLTVDEVEAILDEARACRPSERCVVVDTYCCPRPINAALRPLVEDANARIDGGAELCLANCISADQLSAECVDGQCSIVRCE